MVVLISGLPGTGKSTVARALADRIHASAHSRDSARAMLRKVRPRSARLIDGAYLRVRGMYRPVLQRTANQLLEALVDRTLQDGSPAVVEMVAEPELRHHLRAIAGQHRVSFRQIECVCPDRAELLRRLALRPGDWAAVLRRVEKAYVPPDPAASLILDTTRPVEDLMVDVEAYLRGNAPPPSQPDRRR